MYSNIIEWLAPYSIWISVCLLFLLVVDGVFNNGRYHGIRNTNHFILFAYLYAMPFINLMMFVGITLYAIVRAVTIHILLNSKLKGD